MDPTPRSPCSSTCAIGTAGIPINKFRISGSRRRGTQTRNATEDPRDGSVLAQVDKISTPVLFVDGDLDAGLMALNESLFYEFVYRGKTAEFVRCWGMEHEYGNSLANARALWQRVLARFDDFGDVSRDSESALIFDGERVKSRGGAAPTRQRPFRGSVRPPHHHSQGPAIS